MLLLVVRLLRVLCCVCEVCCACSRRSKHNIRLQAPVQLAHRFTFRYGVVGNNTNINLLFRKHNVIREKTRVLYSAHADRFCVYALWHGFFLNIFFFERIVVADFFFFGRASSEICILRVKNCAQLLSAQHTCAN